jgi:LPS sulfotransferase NodH
LHREDGFKVLYLRRTNLLRHALSNIRARQEGFSRKKGEQTEAGALEVDPETVIEWMRSSEAYEDYEERLLEGVPHLSLTYEENIRDPRHHQETVEDICEFLGIESAPVQTQYKKMAPPSLREGVANYDALVRRLTGTRYAKYLE